jgi:Mlc titration factor MtfA (ptsG expression regulator)
LDSIAVIVLVIVLAGLFIMMIIAGISGVYLFFIEVYTLIHDEARYRIRIKQPLSKNRKYILNKYCAYYNALHSDKKTEFERRVQRFIYSKKFIARSSLLVTDEMTVLISASAIQLTFGLSEIYLSNFDKILIYADSYYSHITKKHHLGEVNPRAGIIILSWKHFVGGYGDLEDGFNVGIHEMAHAIHFENRIKNEEFDFLDKMALTQLAHIANREVPKIVNGEPHILRSYAATNEYEFFAVTLENFFEKPHLLNSELPDLYQTIATLLRQDPLKLHNFNH